MRASGRARRGEAVWACEALIRPRRGCGRSSCAAVCVWRVCVAWPRAVLVDERCAALDE